MKTWRAARKPWVCCVCGKRHPASDAGAHMFDAGQVHSFCFSCERAKGGEQKRKAEGRKAAGCPDCARLRAELAATNAAHAESIQTMLNDQDEWRDKVMKLEIELAELRKRMSELPHCPTCTCAAFNHQVETLAQMIQTALEMKGRKA